MKRLQYFLTLTAIVFLAVLLYPLFVFLCIFNPLIVRGFILKISNGLRILNWLDTISKN